MPEGLPSTSGVAPVPDNKLLLTTTASSSSSTPSLVINTNTILTSVCDTLLSSNSSTPTTPVVNSTVNLVVSTSSVSSTAENPSPICSITYSTSAHKYKLSEIVNQEKDMLFKHEKKSDLELEPPRGDVLTVRRRSRQFFTLIEEDEVDNDLTLAPVSSDSAETKADVQVDPILNLGDSLRRLYFPKERAHYRNKKRNKVRNLSNDCDEERENRQPISTSLEPPLSAGYDSDGGKMGLFDTVLLNPELRSFSSSNPCINEIPDIECNDYDIMTIGSRQSKSLPTTPRVSPKLLRKKSVTTDTQPESMGPGYSFLASVAGDVRLKKMKNEQIQSQQMQRISESNKKYGIMKIGDPGLMKASDTGHIKASDTGHIKATDTGLVKASDTGFIKANNTAVVSLESRSVVVSVSDDHLPHDLEHTNHVSDFSDYLGHKYTSDTPKPLMQSLYDWGTQKKVKVSNKETNMFSPTSF